MTKKKTFIFVGSILLVLVTKIVQAQCVSGDCTNGNGIYIYPSGAKYVGAFKDGEIHGVGTCYYTDGSKYQGEWHYRYPDGKGTKIYSDGTKWTGTWKKGKPIDAEGRLVEDEMVRRGEADNDGTDIQSGCIFGNCQNGQGVFGYADGSKYEGQFKNGNLDGWGTWYFANGDKYIGSFKSNFAHGRGTLYYADGSKAAGDWEKGEFLGNSLIEKGREGCITGDCTNGIGTFIFANAEAKYIGQFRNGLPHGKGACTYANGDRYRGEWANGLFNGMGTLYRKSKPKVAGLWEDGAFVSKQELAQPPAAQTNTEVATNIARQNGLNVWAVIVGVSSYQHMPALKYTDDDAYRMYAFLKSPEGGALSDDRIRILIDEAATKEAILTTMNDVFSKAGANDLVMLYFSGHGVKGSFLPIDFDGYNNKLFHEEINRIFEESHAKYKLCIADACHSGSLLAARSGNTQQTLANYYESLAKAQAGTALIMSSKSEEISLESTGLRQGVFSHFLIRGLKGEADVNNDKIVSVQELFDFVEINVQTYTGMQQSPIIQGDYDHRMTVAVRR